MENLLSPDKLLYLLQLASPSLPVGAYAYSEGLEILVDKGIVIDKATLMSWIATELQYGSIRIETVVIVRSRECWYDQNWQKLDYWNNWLSANRETEELRQQSWQMGESLWKLLKDLHPELKDKQEFYPNNVNYAVAYGIATAYRKIPTECVVIAYLHSWMANLINAGVKLIPLGQTNGQQILLELKDILPQVSKKIQHLKDEELWCISSGLALASMQHQTQYTRLFRS